MPSYNFKKKVKFYVVMNGLKYLVDIYPDISFSQTFKESTRKVKTLHAQTDMFDAAIINEASPANFNFTMPLYTSLEVKPVLGLLLDYANSSEVTLQTADIYVDTGVEIFKLEKSVFERGTFNIGRAGLVTVSISGTASKLTLFGPSGTIIPGSIQTFTTGNSTFLESLYMQIDVEGITQTGISSVSVEVSNDVSWLPNNTLHKSLAVTGASDTTYPEAFVVSGRNVSGTLQQYLTDTNRDSVNTWAIGVPLNIWIGRDQNFYSLKFSLPQVVYTNRLEVGDLFMQNYDFRSISNPASLSTIINYSLPEYYFNPVSIFLDGKDGVLFVPSDISSQYQEDTGITQAIVNNPVGKITDKSGNAHHATSVQGGPTARPVLMQDVSGYKFLRFDGINDTLNYIASLNLIRDYTLIAGVISRQTPGTNGFANLQSTADASFAAMYADSNTGTRLYYNGGSIITENYVGGSVKDIARVITMRASSTGNSFIRINGVQIGTSNSTSTYNGTVTGGIGSGVTNGQYGQVDIYGLLIVEGIITDLSQAESWMGSQMGIII